MVTRSTFGRLGRAATLDCESRDPQPAASVRNVSAKDNSVEVVSKADPTVANERASEPTRAEWGLRGPASERVGESEGRSPSEWLGNELEVAYV